MRKILVYFGLITVTAINVSAQTIQDAKKLTDNEQYEEASTMYQSLIALSPSNANLYYFFGDNLLLSENADSAKIIFDKGRQIDAANGFIKIGTAKFLFDEINVRDAKASVDKDGANPELKARYETALQNVAEGTKLIDEAITTAAPKDPALFIEAAEACINYNNKNLDKAKLLLDRAAAIDANNVEINLLYGDIYTELFNGTLAAEYYNKALDLKKSSARAIVSKGRLYKKSTNYEGAAEEFKRAITFEPSYAPAHRELGEAFFKLGKLDAAKEEYRKYLELSKNNCGARIRYASFLYISKGYTEALSELAQVEQRCNPNNIKLLRIQTYSYYETKDYTKGLAAVNHLFSVLSVDKRIDRDYEYYGKLLIATSQDSLGIEQLQKAVALDPTRTDLLSEMAMSWFNLKQYGNAINLLNQKIISGKDVRVADYYNLGRSYYYDNQFGLADSNFMKVTELSPKYSSGWLFRADANSHIDSTSELGLAKPYYEKYIEIAEGDSANQSKYVSGLIKAYGYLAYYYILKKDNAAGLVYLKKKLTLPLDPDDKKNVTNAIDQLEGRGPKKK